MKGSICNDGGTVHCADCFRCKQVREGYPSGRFVLKARCAAGHWVRGRVQLTLDIHRIHAKWVRGCPDYVSTSDDDEDRARFLAELPDSLPLARIVFEADGSAADLG